MSLRQQVDDELKAAMKAMGSGGDPVRLETCRMLKSAVKYREIELGQPLDDAGVTAVVSSLVKQRREAIEQYRAGGRPDAAAKEEAEIVVLQGFLPAQLSAEDVQKLVDETIAETGAAGMKDMGKVMAALKSKTAGRAEGKTLSDLVRARLQKGA